jgi:hypothetical protein
MSLTILGDKTPSAVIFKSESHKLAHSFPVKEGKTIKKGQPIVLNTDGTVQAFEATDSLAKIIGYAITDSTTPAYAASKQYGAVEVTVAVKGHAILNAVAGGALSAGPVKPSGALDATSRYAKYVALAGGDPTVAIALNDADADGDLIQVLFL